MDVYKKGPPQNGSRGLTRIWIDSVQVVNSSSSHRHLFDSFQIRQIHFKNISIGNKYLLRKKKGPVCVCPVNIRRRKKGFPGENLERLDGRVMRGRTGRGYASCGAVTTTLPYTQKTKKTFFPIFFRQGKIWNIPYTHILYNPVCVGSSSGSMFFFTYSPPPLPSQHCYWLAPPPPLF